MFCKYFDYKYIILMLNTREVYRASPDLAGISMIAVHNSLINSSYYNIFCESFKFNKEKNILMSNMIEQLIETLLN